jgi:hypothetical protein
MVLNPGSRAVLLVRSKAEHEPHPSVASVVHAVRNAFRAAGTAGRVDN